MKEVEASEVLWLDLHRRHHFCRLDEPTEHPEGGRRRLQCLCDALLGEAQHMYLF